MDAIAGTTKRYYYDDQRIVLQTESDGTSQTERTFIYGNYIDEVLVMSVIPAQAGIQDFYYGHDHLYSPTALFEDDGDVVERYEYDVYGMCRIMDSGYSLLSSSVYSNPYYFTGREIDLMDSGSCKLMYYRARAYDPQTGRFLQRDPAQYVDGMNLYEYAVSNSMIKTDSFGLKSCYMSLWDKNDPDLILHHGWMSEIRKRDSYELSFGIQNFNIESLIRAMKRNCCSCINMVTIYDHGCYKKVGAWPYLTIGYQWYGNRLLKGSDIRPLCPYLCDDAKLYLEGCYVGRSDRKAFDMLFGACKKITIIRGCYGPNYFNYSGHSKCEGGYRYFLR